MAESKSQQQLPQVEPFYALAKESQETENQFQMRLHVYDEAVKTGIDHERAIVLMNVFKNAYYMGCTYHEDVMKESMRFWPQQAIDKPLYQ
eukprot:403354884